MGSAIIGSVAVSVNVASCSGCRSAAAPPSSALSRASTAPIIDPAAPSSALAVPSAKPTSTETSAIEESSSVPRSTAFAVSWGAGGEGAPASSPPLPSSSGVSAVGVKAAIAFAAMAAAAELTTAATAAAVTAISNGSASCAGATSMFSSSSRTAGAFTSDDTLPCATKKWVGPQGHEWRLRSC